MPIIDLVTNEPITSSTFVREEELKTTVMTTEVKMGSIKSDAVTIQVIEGYSSLWTNDVGPCHVICVYGYNDKGTLAHLGMAHFAFDLETAVDGCLEKLKEKGCQTFKIYLVGGDSTSVENAKKLMIKHDLSAAVSPVNKEGEFVNVTMYTDHIGFQKAG